MKAAWFRVVALLILGLSAASPSMAHAADRHEQGDDKCVAKCDEDADRCNQQAGKDGGKQRNCDDAYDACLRQCN
jgi:hypothetical protein